MHPSAVALNPAAGKSYAYDANGNMTARMWFVQKRMRICQPVAGAGRLLAELP